MRYVPSGITVNSPLKRMLFHAPECIPVPKSSRGIKSNKVKGIGVYYYPSTNNNIVQTCSSSAVLWLHGGGRILGSAYSMKERDYCHKIVDLLGVPVLSAKYRLAPKHPFPAALDDARMAYQWLAGKLAETCTSKVKIALAGESAGGGLAAELSQWLLDANNADLTIPLPVCQLLIYPMLDDRTCVDNALSKVPPHMVWNNKSNKYAWSSYLGKKYSPGDEQLPNYASASRRINLSNLPPAFVLVGDMDLFHQECVEYARRLREDGVQVELMSVKGGFHGMISFANMAPLDKEPLPIVEGWERFQAFGKRYLSD